jgi:ribonuclease P protein component
MNISKTLNIVTISHKNEIKDVIAKGQRVYTKFGLLFLYRDNIEVLNKIGILVKKQSGNAVKRNYIKRIIRQFVRNEYILLQHYSKIIFLFNYKGKISYNEIRDTYINHLKKYEKIITNSN